MIAGDLKNKIDQIWDAFWSGGIADPLTVVEQKTYLLFLKRLDELETQREAKLKLGAKDVRDSVFGPEQQEFRWSRFKDLSPQQMYELFTRPTGVFDFMKNLNDRGGSTYGKLMENATFMIPSAGLLDKDVRMLDAIPMENRDTKGDLYEYILSSLATSGKNGQFRTPRHIIKMMVEMVEPRPNDLICDPASGTCGFLMAAGEYLREHNEDIFYEPEKVEKLPIPLPAVEEQKRIAAILDTADRLRSLRERAIAKLDELAKSIFLDMIGDPVTNPKGWPVIQIDDLGSVQGGLQLTPKRAAEPIKVPYLRVANVLRDRLDLSEIKIIRISQRELVRTRLREGDILVVEGHSNPEEIGRCAIWDGSIYPITHQNHLTRFRPEPSLLRASYFSMVLNSEAGRRQLWENRRTTSGLNTLSTSTLKRMRLPVAPIKLQEQFERNIRFLGRYNSRIDEDKKTGHAFTIA